MKGYDGYESGAFHRAVKVLVFFCRTAGEPKLADPEQFPVLGVLSARDASVFLLEHLDNTVNTPSTFRKHSSKFVLK